MKHKGNSFLRLLGYECRKAFWNPAMLIFIAVLLLLNGVKISDSFRKADLGEKYEDVYTVFYNGYVGKITDDKWTHLETIYRPLLEKAKTMSLSNVPSANAYTYSEASDFPFFQGLFYDQMAYDLDYEKNAAEWTENAQNLQFLYKQVGNSYGLRRMEALKKVFSGRRIPDFGETWSWDVLLQHDYSAMLVLLLSIFALSGMFVTEQETDMIMLLQTTPNGGFITIGAKLTAAAIFTLVVCILFFAEDFLVVFLMSGRTEALSGPVYAMQLFRLTPLAMKLWQYFLWAAFMKFLGALFCGYIILLISSVVKQSLTGFFISFAVLIGCVILQEFSGSTVLFKLMNPMELVIPRNLVKQCTFGNVFGFPVPLYGEVLLGCTVLALLLLAGILYNNRSYHRKGRKRKYHAEI